MKGADLVVIVPIWRRTEHIMRVRESVLAATPDARVLFVPKHDDPDALAAVEHLDHIVGEWPGGSSGDYARSINLAYRASDEPFIFTGADDLHFHPGWYEHARSLMETPWPGEPPERMVGVVGTVDLCNDRTMRGESSTHSLVARWYADEYGLIDRPGAIYAEVYEHEYCQPPDATIWMADATFKPIGDVLPGDEVVGWVRGGPQGEKLLAPATVRSVRERSAPIVRVALESGRTVRCTPDHRWYNGHHAPSNASPEWVTPQVGRSLLHVVDEPPHVADEHQRLAGWLAGIYDGEGSRIQIAQCPIANPEVTAAIHAALAKLDISFTAGRGAADHMVTLTGGRQGALDFLLRVAPVKRESLLHVIFGGRWDGTTRNRWGGRRFGQRDRIVAVEPDGHGTVVSLTTSTGNYIGQGYASRNCDDELVETARSRGMYAHAFDAVVEHLHPNAGKAPDDPTYQRGRSRTLLSRRRFRYRRRLWTK